MYGLSKAQPFYIIMKKLFLLIVAAMMGVIPLLAQDPAQVAVDDGVADITLTAPNTLRNVLADLEPTLKITHLTMHGALGSDDLSVIHTHTGRLSEIEVVDLSDVTLVADEGQYASFQAAKSDVGMGKTINTYFLSNRNETETYRDLTGLGGFNVDVKLYTTDLGGLLYGCTSLKRLVLPKGLRSIGDRIATNCTALEEVVLTDAEGIMEVKDEAFKGCSSLTRLSLPNPQIIGSHAFEGTMVSDIELKNATAIGEWAFYGAKGLRKADLSRLTTVLDCTFYGCENLKEVIWADSLTSIGDMAFVRCAIESADLPGTIRRINSNAFDGTTWLEEQKKTVTEGIIYAGKAALMFAPKWEIPENTTLTIADGTTATSVGLCPDYSWADKITKIVVPASMKYIGGMEGYNLSAKVCFAGLKEVNLPEGLEYIGPNTFRHTQLTTVSIPSSVTEIGDYAFSNATSLIAINYNASGEVTGSSIFANCEALEKVTLGTKVRNIPRYMFEKCANLLKVEFDTGGDNGKFCIGSGAFSGCTALTSFTFPENLDSIGADAFRNTGIVKAVLPQGTRSIDRAFTYCAKLTEVVLPESMKCILNDDTFYGAPLEKIYDYHVAPLQIKDDDEFYVFRQLSKTATVYVMPGCVEAFKADPIWRYFTIEVMDEEHQATGTNAVVGSTQHGNAAVYDLQGRRIGLPRSQSIIIKDGKKYFVDHAY